MPIILPPVAESFRASSIKAAKRFLQTAMLFDDNATFSEPAIARPETVIAPTSNEPDDFEEESDIPADSGTSEPEIYAEPVQTGENLYAKLINDAFAKEGIVCGVIKPVREDQTAIEAIKKAAKRADIVVVDWSIDGDQGATAMNIIDNILQDDQNRDSEDHQGRLRLLAIYTFEPDLSRIATTIKDRFGFEELGQEDVNKKFTLTLDNNVRLCIYQKDRGSENYYGPNRERVVKDDKLPEKLIEDFSDMTSGLLFNLVLNALGALRENTHRLLQKFNASIDASYFTHRVLSNPMEDTQDHPLTLFTAEIEDILLDQQVNKSIGKDAVESWLEYLAATHGLKFATSTNTDILPLLKSLNQTGISSYTKAQNPTSDIIKLLNKLKDGKEDNSKLTSVFSKDLVEANTKDIGFAVLTTFRSHYLLPPPQLRLGSVVCLGANDLNAEYFICIQPVCDATRLKNIQYTFPFIELKSAESTGRFDLTFTHNSLIKQFVIHKKPSQMRLLTFIGNEVSQAVVANKIIKEGSDVVQWVFETVDSKKLEWIGELRFPHAQRVANNIAAELARVGLTESEWLRRAATRPS